MNPNEETNFKLRELILSVIVKIISRERRKSEAERSSKILLSSEELAIIGILAVSSWEIENFNSKINPLNYTIQPSLDEKPYTEIIFFSKEIEILTAFINSDPDKEVTQLLQAIVNVLEKEDKIEQNIPLRFLLSTSEDKLDDYRNRINNTFLLNSFISKALNPAIEKCNTQGEIGNLLDNVGYILSFEKLKINHFPASLLKERIAGFLEEGKTTNSAAITRAHGLRGKVSQILQQSVGRNPDALFTGSLHCSQGVAKPVSPRGLHSLPNQIEMTGIVNQEEEEKKLGGPR